MAIMDLLLNISLPERHCAFCEGGNYVYFVPCLTLVPDTMPGSFLELSKHFSGKEF